MHAEKDDRVMEGKQPTNDEIREAFDILDQVISARSDGIEYRALETIKTAHAEIEELTKSLGTYYDLNMKLEQQVLDTENELTEAINCIEDQKYKEEFH